ncbi:MAG: caspase family protein, partial [Pyrinomonadaceae bacterium]
MKTFSIVLFFCTVMVVLQRPTSAQSKLQAPPEPNKRFALIIGVEAYDKANGIIPLVGPENDANSLGDAIIKNAGFPEKNVIIMSSKKVGNMLPTKNNIIRELSKLKNKVPSEGMLLVAFSGHGIETGGETYFLAQDSMTFGTDSTALATSSVSLSLLKQIIQDGKIQQVLVFFDACREDPEDSKGVRDNRLSTKTVTAATFDEINKSIRGFAVLFASSPGQRSFTIPGQNRGYFSAALVDGIKGKAAGPDGSVTLASLMDYVRNK